jgi:uncharacterized protein YukE
MGNEADKEKKEMTRHFGKLPKAQREAVEAEYHGMNPRAFEETMARAKRHSPAAIRLPRQLVQNLKAVAESEGEAEYQSMVRRWIEERLKQETSTRD